MTKKIAVFNRKGGVGKTTLAIILTQIALAHKESVLAVDLDPQKNSFSSLEYLTREKNFSKLFTLKHFDSSVTQKDLATNADWLIMDCPPNLGDNALAAIRYADFVLVPVCPDRYSIEPIHEIMNQAGNKKPRQFQLVKIDFTENGVRNKVQAAKEISQDISRLKYNVIADLPLYEKIRANLSLRHYKWWSFGLAAKARAYFEALYGRIKML